MNAGRMDSREWERLRQGARIVDRMGAVRVFSLDEVEDWAERNGGELAVRNALATEEISHPTCVQVARAWLMACERQRVEQHAAQTLATDIRAAQASERAARYAMWSAAISAATGIVSAAAYWITRVPG